MSTLRKKFAVALMLALGGTMAAHAEPKPAAKDIVIVHGALVDGSGWRALYDILSKDGFHVTIVQEPLTSLTEDVEATKRIIGQQKGPVGLVGHSYAGSVITDAGTDPKVKTLVYVAALQPDAGEASGQLLAKSAPTHHATRVKQALNCCQSPPRPTTPCGHPKSISSSRQRDSVRSMRRTSRPRMLNSWRTSRSSLTARTVGRL